MAVTLAPHDPAWVQAFAAEAVAISAAVPGLTLHHIGSTAIPGILAKPIIDMLGDVPALRLVEAASPRLAALGYQVMGAFGIEGRRYFRKDDARGNRTHHLHVFASGSAHLVRHLAFRDYLRAHPDVAAAYAATKAALAHRDDYADAKAPFVRATEAEALAWTQVTASDCRIRAR
ncbi:MAG: GrpB family protein [Polymorphobacter sp.]